MLAHQVDDQGMPSRMQQIGVGSEQNWWWVDLSRIRGYVSEQMCPSQSGAACFSRDEAPPVELVDPNSIHQIFFIGKHSLICPLFGC